VSREVRPSHGLFAARLIDDDVGEGSDLLSIVVPLKGLADYLGSLGIEGCVARQRPCRWYSNPCGSALPGESSKT